MRFSLAAVALLILCAGCDRPANSQTGNPAATDPRAEAPASAIQVQKTFGGKYPIRVCATTGMVADLARNVGGRHVNVTHLMGEGVDPHLYKASPGDVAQLSAADLIFYSGLHLEGKMGDLFVRMARRKPTFAVSEYIPEDVVLETESGAHDPHVWFDVSLWAQAANVVRDALTAFDPTHAADYRENAERYGAKLEKLHREAKQTLSTIPKDRRVLVTAHDAFRYFGRAYDVEVRGIQGISTESEAGVREINELVKFIADRKIKAVFVESSVSEDNIRALVEGCRAKGHDVSIGGQLFSDAMGRDGTPEGTYIGMVRHNVNTITHALK